KAARHPVIVAENERAEIVGWGSLNVFNARDAYRHVVDLSVYAERSQRGKGVGSALLSRLIELSREHGFHKLVLSAFPTNHGGMALYNKHGFRTVGIYKEQGLLDGHRARAADQAARDRRARRRHVGWLGALG